ncbi:hypothetical protein [Actinomadura algeriensis]|uniref:Uncharacterized protein n=1 Tax=Actinomadura algeriensis TaxID=1679523 RepID=A0ABR9JL50_9ACTN|nr:hypothetical protein [Actinomadura algeriensis]MBE1531277.1 hypothetical protein [Actinomadura algeriensis]
MRGLNRTRLGLLIVGFVVVIGLMEWAALSLGSVDVPLPSNAPEGAVTDTNGAPAAP